MEIFMQGDRNTKLKIFYIQVMNYKENGKLYNYVIKNKNSL